MDGLAQRRQQATHHHPGGQAMLGIDGASAARPAQRGPPIRPGRQTIDTGKAMVHPSRSVASHYHAALQHTQHPVGLFAGAVPLAHAHTLIKATML